MGSHADKSIFSNSALRYWCYEVCNGALVPTVNQPCHAMLVDLSSAEEVY